MDTLFGLLYKYFPVDENGNLERIENYQVIAPLSLDDLAKITVFVEFVYGGKIMYELNMANGEVKTEFLN